MPRKHYTLASLRVALGLTQTDLAHHAEMNQGDVSALERRDDFKLSTMKRYAKALGGKLEVAVVIRGRRYLINH